ncbi:MAG: hypothetical protein M0T77_06380 [Actinomycetota bacterium]|nr:hypothetical protein [Actinomycetota bacterium]
MVAGEPEPPVTDPQPPLRRAAVGEVLDVTLRGLGLETIERRQDPFLNGLVEPFEVLQCRFGDLNPPGLFGRH